MADKKISALTAATTPLAGTEVLPIVQSGSTVKVANNDLRPKQIQSNATSGVLQIAGPAAAATRVMTVPDANFTAARTDAANSFTGDQTLSTGNLIQGTAAKGVNFTANTPAAGKTSQLLNWYEEGTWTPTLTTSGTDFTSVSYFPDAVNGRYTRIGNLVTIQGSMRTTAITVGSASGNLRIGGLPFTAANVAFSDSCVAVAGVSGFATNQPSAGRVVGNTTQIQLEYRAAANGATSDMGFAEANTGYNVNTINFSATYRV